MNTIETTNVGTKEEFEGFLDKVLIDYSQNSESWENPDLPRFLEALQAWLQSCDGYYQNQQIDIASVNPWRQIADAVAAARIYE